MIRGVNRRRQLSTLSLRNSVHHTLSVENIQVKTEVYTRGIFTRESQGRLTKE